MFAGDKCQDLNKLAPHYGSAAVKPGNVTIPYPSMVRNSLLSQPTTAVTYQPNCIYENAAREPQLIIPLQTHNQSCTLVNSVQSPCEFGDSSLFLQMSSNVGTGTNKSSRLLQLPARPSMSEATVERNSTKRVSALSSRSSNNSPSLVSDENCRYCAREEVVGPERRDVRDASHLGSSLYASVDPMFYCDNYTALEMCVNGAD